MKSFIEKFKCSEKNCTNTGRVAFSLIDSKGKERTKAEAKKNIIWYCEKHEGKYK